MPEITVIHIALLTLVLFAGIVVGWATRSSRCTKEKTAINVGWHEQLSAQRSEHDRLGGQNKSLMEQVNQYQASNTDAKLRAKELSDALKEAFERRDELQRQIKDIRNNLETAVAERNQLQSDMQNRSASADTLSEKDEKIFRLSRELDRWQDRLPPLIERFQTRNQEALQLEADLADAREQINALETMVGSDQTRVEPVNPNSLTDGMDASNDSIDAPQPEQSTEQQEYASDAPFDEFEESSNLVSSDDDANENDRIDALIENFRETATNQLLDDLDDLNSGIDDGDEKEEIVTESADPAAEDSFNGELNDNLKQIKGIGPAIENTLNEMGISRFSQIAEMSEYDIDRIAKRLKGFRSRIYREDWIGQAREFHSQKTDDGL
jgi:predicted flap endonuclease-1-like 5' DNA nuclease